MEAEARSVGRRRQHFHAEAVQARPEIGGHLRFDIHDDVAVVGIGHIGLEAVDARRERLTGLHLHLVEQL